MILKEMAVVSAQTAIEWSRIPRFPIAPEDPMWEVKDIWNKALYAVYFNDLSRALTIQKQLVNDLEMLVAENRKMEYGPAAISAQLRLAELKSISESSAEIQTKYRLVATKMQEIGTANLVHDYETSVRRAVEVLELLNEFPEQSVVILRCTTRQILAVALSRTSNHSLALEILRKNVDLQKKMFGEQHPEYLFNVAMMATELWDMKEYIQAESYFRQCIIVLRAQQGKKSYKYARVLTDFAAVLIGQQKFTEAESLTLHAASILQSLNHENQYGMAACWRNLGQIALAAGEYKEAEEHFAHAWHIYNNCGTNTLNDLILVQECFAALERATNNPNSAERREKSIVEMLKKYALSEETLRMAGKPDPQKLQ